MTQTQRQRGRDGAVLETATPWQRRRDERDLGMLREHREVLAAAAREGRSQSMTMLKAYLKGKYGLCSDSGYYAALQRAEDRSGESRWPEGYQRERQ